MRIGIVYLGRRGAGNPFSLQLARHLRAHAELFAVVSAHAENLAQWQAASLEHFPVKTYRSPLEAALAFVDRRMVTRLATEIRTRCPDVLFFPFFYTLNPLVQRSLPEIPAVVVVHDPVPHPGLAGRVYRSLEDVSLRRAQRSILLSRVFLPDLQRRGVPVERIDWMVHGPLDYGALPPAAGQGDDGPPRLLFFGRISENKGLEVLLKAYRELRLNRPLRLRIAGAGDLAPYRSLLSGLEGVEVINRWVEEAGVPELFRGAAVVVLPYTTASQSGVLALAASYGLPVVATRAGGIPEQVRGDETGVLVEPGSIDSLVEGIRRVLDAPAWAAELGAALRREYQETHGWAVAAAQAAASCRRAVEMWQARQGGNPA